MKVTFFHLRILYKLRNSGQDKLKEKPFLELKRIQRRFIRAIVKDDLGIPPNW
jgi:hypothetical protein